MMGAAHRNRIIKTLHDESGGSIYVAHRAMSELTKENQSAKLNEADVIQRMHEIRNFEVTQCDLKKA